MKVWFVLLMLVLASTDALAGTRLYRYENRDGVVVIDYSVPPELVYKGYEVLNAQGRVIEVVPRSLTPEELKARASEEQSKQDQARQAENDKKLLSIFSGPADAERARDRKIEALDVYINITRGNILKLREDLNVAQAQAAARERAGQSVQDFIIEKVDSLQRQIDQAEASITEKEGEKDVIRNEYAKDIERLRELEQMRQQNRREIRRQVGP